MTDQPTYGPWIIWNATDGSKCPVGEGVRGQLQFAKENRHQAERRKTPTLHDYEWSSQSAHDIEITAYRLLLEPVVVETEYRVGAACIGERGPMIGTVMHIEGWEIGTATVTKVDGKLTRIVWEADK